jgi:hypothetical protein
LPRRACRAGFIEASTRELQRLQEHPLGDPKWLVLVLDGKTFAGDQLVMALTVTTMGEKRILSLVQISVEEPARYRQLPAKTRRVRVPDQ